MTEQEQREIISRNIKERCRLSGKTQKDVAKDLGLPYSTLNSWVRARSTPQVSMIQKLADYFVCSKSDIVDDKEETKNKYDTKDVDLLLKINMDGELKEILVEYFNQKDSDKERLRMFMKSYMNKFGE